MSFGEVETILQAQGWVKAGHRAALATVIRTNGSAPRQPGSHLAIREDGVFAGSVSAGCVENIVMDTAQQAMADGKIHRLAMDSAPALPSPLDTGLTCGGKIEILVEPFQDAAAAAIQQAQVNGTLIVRALELASGKERLLAPPWTADPLAQAAQTAVENETCGIVRVDGSEWLLLSYLPRPELVIVGAVHIAQALAPLAAMSGYAVRIIDPRTAYSTGERFTGITVCNEWPDDALARRPLTCRDSIVTLSHDAKLDDAALAAALHSPARYIGALGSGQSHSRRLSRLRALGFDDAQLGRIRGPVGLSISARTPAEIALAILAQMVESRRRPRIAGIVLAAGQARRMGFNKLTIAMMGKPLVRHAVEAAQAGGLTPIIVVTGHEDALVRAGLDGMPVTFAHNEAFADGMGGSLARGIRAVPFDCAGAMVLLGDMPGISPALVRQVSDAFDPAQCKTIAVACAGATRGHPVLWGRAHFAALEKLSGDSGGKPLMQERADQVTEIQAGDDMPLSDVDTLADLKRWQS